MSKQGDVAPPVGETQEQEKESEEFCDCGYKLTECVYPECPAGDDDDSQTTGGY